MGHFVSSPRKREKRDRRDSRGDEREGQGRKRNRNESKETEEIETFPLYPYLLQGQQAFHNCKQISVGRPSEVRYTTPSPNPTTPAWVEGNAVETTGCSWLIHLLMPLVRLSLGWITLLASTSIEPLCILYGIESLFVRASSAT